MTTMPEAKKIVIIGGVACGCKAAARARRLDPQSDITIVEQGDSLSYAGCGMPYYIQGRVAEMRDLMCTPVGVPRNPDFFRAVKGIRALVNTRAVTVDRKKKTVEVIHLNNGQHEILPYDKLVLATGAYSVMPRIEGIGLDYVFGLREPRQASAIRDAISGGSIKTAVIVGGGLIGLEMSEALRERGLAVTVVEMMPHILPGLLDDDIALHVEKHLRDKGVKIVTGERVTALKGDAGRVAEVVTDKQTLPAQMVLVSVGVRPHAQLAVDAGLAIGPHGGIIVDECMRTSDADIYAGGDSVESRHVLTGDYAYVPLGSTANKHGRVIGTNLAGGNDRFPGIIGTSIVKVFDYTVGRAGLTVKEAEAKKLATMNVVVPATDRPHYYPGAKPVIIKLVADVANRKVLGAQVIGTGQADKRIDVLATAIGLGATVDQVGNLDLAYAPPYSEALDNVIVAANVLRNLLDGVTSKVSPQEVKQRLDKGEDFVLLDVRSPQEFETMRIDDPRVRLMPLGRVRSDMGNLSKDKPIVTLCKVSLRGYEAQRILAGAGFTNVSFMEGGLTAWPYELVSGPVAAKPA